MKKYSSLLFIILGLALTQCLEPTEKVVSYENTEEIQRKLQELRNIQREVETSGTTSANYQIEIANKIEELNELIAPGNIPITYSIGIISAAGSQDAVGIANATVTLNVRGEQMTATTSTDGQVVFENLRSGIVLVHIAVEGYTDASFIADIRVDEDDDYNHNHSGNPYNVTSAIALYPTTSANGAGTVAGNLYFDPNRTDDIVDNTDPNYGVVNYFSNDTGYPVYSYRPAEKIDFVDNSEVNRSQGLLDARMQSWETLASPVKVFAFVRPNALDYSSVPFGTAGNILVALYEEMFVTVTSSATGSYSLTIPAGINSNNVRISLEEFTGTEQYIRATNLNTTTGLQTVTLRERTVVYTPMYALMSDDTQYPGDFTGFGYSFSKDRVNNFTAIASERRARRVDVYFGARTRDE